MAEKKSTQMITDLVRDRSASAALTRFADDVRTGLSATPKHLSSQYFYDEIGMRLFQNIMELPEYYLTNCEHEIFTTHREALCSKLSEGPLNILDLGSGDGRKTKILLQHFLQRNTSLNYFPIDISLETLHELTDALCREMPALPVHAVAAEYFDAMQWVAGRHEGNNLALFLGSNIGNFSPSRARNFLQRLHDTLRVGDHALIGFDLKKNPREISRAYDDAAGVTAEFNLNLLDRINRELGGDFRRDAFMHYAYYDEPSGAVKSFVVSTKQQQVNIASLNETISFDAWEHIHTEDSWKYSLRDIAAFARDCGFEIIAEFFDHEKRFVDSLWRAL